MDGIQGQPLVCNTCTNSRPLREFRKGAKTLKTCALCRQQHRINNKKYCAKDKPTIRARSRAANKKWYHKDVKSARFLRRFYKYGLTQEDFDVLLELQGGLCAICSGALAETTIHVDHDHVALVVRGLLCFQCNAALGSLKEDVVAIRKAATYLEQARSALLP